MPPRVGLVRGSEAISMSVQHFTAAQSLSNAQHDYSDSEEEAEDVSEEEDLEEYNPEHDTSSEEEEDEQEEEMPQV